MLNPRCIILWTLACSCACQAQAVSNSAKGNDDPQLAAVALAFILVPTLIYTVRRRLIWHIKQQMLVVSAAASDDDDEEAGANDVDARRPLSLVFHDADEPFAIVVNPRLRAEKRLFRQVCLADFGIALAYAVLPLLFGLLAFQEAATAGSGMGLVLAGFTLMRYLLHRGQFRAYNLSRSRPRQRVYRWLGRIMYGILMIVTLGTGATAVNLVYLPDILRAIFGPRMRMILSILFVAGTAFYAIPILLSGQENKAEAFGLLCAAFLHACLFVALTRRLRKVAGLRLLILRVFKVDETSSFLFSGLMRYWRYFGNHLTIVDESLVRQGYSNSFAQTVFLAFGLIAALLVAFLIFLAPWIESRIHHPLSWGWNCVVVTVPALLAGWVTLRIGKLRIDSNFTRNLDQVLASLRSVEVYPRRLDLSFRHLRALCHNNTWFPAVRAFANRADVVLMDLRGYTEQRKGCQKEINFLFDAVPLAHLLLLVDTANDQTVVGHMLQGLWERLNNTSPNLSLPNPVVHLYQVQDNDKRDMQAILDRLIQIADADGLSAPERGRAVPA